MPLWKSSVSQSKVTAEDSLSVAVPGWVACVAVPGCSSWLCVWRIYNNTKKLGVNESMLSVYEFFLFIMLFCYISEMLF